MWGSRCSQAILVTNHNGGLIGKFLTNRGTGLTDGRGLCAHEWEIISPDIVVFVTGRHVCGLTAFAYVPPYPSAKRIMGCNASGNPVFQPVSQDELWKTDLGQKKLIRFIKALQRGLENDRNASYSHKSLQERAFCDAVKQGQPIIDLLEMYTSLK